MASRRKSRELALQMLFQWEVGKHSTAHVIATFLNPKEAEGTVNSFARDLFQGTVDEIPALDPKLRETAKNWRLERMGAIDRNVLRLALFELIHYPQTPPAVVINEALEIARRFSGEESAEFVNGILDAVRKVLPIEGATANSNPVAPAVKTPAPKQQGKPSKRSKGN